MRPIQLTLWLILAAATLLSAAGCNIVGPAMYLVQGPNKTPAQFTLPQQTTVVFIDDRANILPRSRLIRQMALGATNELLKVQQIIPEAIDPEAINREAVRETSGHLMSIDEIGRKVGAGVVIYAVPRQFSLVDDRGTVPTCILEVKVVDTESGLRLWPGPREYEYHRLVVELAYKSPLRYDDGKVDELQQQLATTAGLRLAQLFFPHEKNPLDARVPD